jgi:hypothetical protein
MKILLAQLVTILVLGAAVFAPPAKAVPPNCIAQPWGFLGSQRRVMCDSPIQPDASWMRSRTIWTPAHQIPSHTSCYGKYSVSCDTWGGGWVDDVINSDDTYPVTPDTVPPDEPGHLG